jgi:hypothetical protein
LAALTEKTVTAADRLYSCYDERYKTKVNKAKEASSYRTAGIGKCRRHHF